MIIRLTAAFAAMAVSFLAFGGNARAEYPERTITLLSGFQASGNVDLVARAVARSLERQLGQTVIVETKAGAGGGVMATQLKAAKPDGYTLGFSVSATWTSNPVLFPNVAYKAGDFTYIGSVARAQEGFVVAASSPYKTFREVVDAAKKGEKITVGSLSPINNLMFNAINRKEGTKIALVPLKSGSEVVPMLMGNHITLGFTGGFHQPFVEQGQLRVIVSSHTARLAASPDVPSLDELGYVSVPASLQVLVAPAGLPDAIRDRLSKALSAAVREPELVDLVEKKMYLPIEHHAAAAIAGMIADEAKRLAEIAKDVK